MEPPYEEQYSQEGNPRAYMTMRDYRNLAWQNQQPLGRNPNPNRSMKDYRDQWMSAPVYSVPSAYAPPPHPQYASLSQPQPSQPISLVEQAILDLTKLVGDAMVEQKEFNAQLSEKIHTEENSLDQSLDGLNIDFEHKWDNLQDSIEVLIDQQQCPPEEDFQSDIMAEERCEQQPHQELIEDFIELSEGLAESSYMCDVVFPRENQEEIISLLIEEGSKTKAVEVPKKNVIQPNPIDLDTTATAQDTKYPLPVAPSADQVYFLPSPTANSKPAAPKAKSNPLSAMQKFKKLVAIAQIFATTSKAQAAAYTAWHSGWFGCRFGFGASEPRHFRAPLVPAASKGIRKWFGGTQSPPLLVLIFLVLFYFIAFYLDFYNFSL